MKGNKGSKLVLFPIWCLKCWLGIMKDLEGMKITWSQIYWNERFSRQVDSQAEDVIQLCLTWCLWRQRNTDHENFAHLKTDNSVMGLKSFKFMIHLDG